MTVFVWNPPPMPEVGSDEWKTVWQIPDARCQFCGEHVHAGQKVLAYKVALPITFHVECVKRYAPGFLKDIAECMK